MILRHVYAIIATTLCSLVSCHLIDVETKTILMAERRQPSSSSSPMAGADIGGVVPERRSRGDEERKSSTSSTAVPRELLSKLRDPQQYNKHALPTQDQGAICLAD